MFGRSGKLLAALAFTSVGLFASTVTMKFNAGSGVAPTLADGSADQVGPYTAFINGSPLTTVIFCDDFSDSVSPGESWTANLTILSSGNLSNTLYGPGLIASHNLAYATQLYDEVAWLALQFANNVQADWGGIQSAMWQIMNSSAPNTNPNVASSPTSTAYWLLQAAANFGHVNNANVEILTLASGTKTSTGASSVQEFLVLTPEPATYALFGSGLILLSLGTFRRRRNKSS